MSYEELQKYFKEMNSFTADVTLEITSEKSKSVYSFKSKYLKDQYFSYEIVEPEELLGQIILFQNSQMKIYNPKLQHSIEIENIFWREETNQFPINFLPLINTSGMKEELKNNINCYVMESSKNTCLWIDANNRVPYIIELRDGETTKTVTYKNFKYNDMVNGAP